MSQQPAQWVERFFALLETGHTLSQAASVLNITTQAIYSKRNRDYRFARRLAGAGVRDGRKTVDNTDRRAFKGSDTLARQRQASEMLHPGVLMLSQGGCWTV